MGGLSKKEKDSGTQTKCGDCRGGDGWRRQGIRGINGNGKNTNNTKVKMLEFSNLIPHYNLYGISNTI